MFLERLNEDEIYDIVKNCIKYELQSTKFICLSSDDFTLVKQNKKSFKKILECYKKFENVVLYKKNFFTRNQDKNNDQFINLELDVLMLFKKVNKKNKSTFKVKSISSKMRYNIQDFQFSFNVYTLIDYYKYMYKKFGEEYLNELKRYYTKQKDDFIKYFDTKRNFIIKELTK